MKIRTLAILLVLTMLSFAMPAAAQTPVNIRSASLPGRSMEYWGNSRSACLVPAARMGQEDVEIIVR